MPEGLLPFLLSEMLEGVKWLKGHRFLRLRRDTGDGVDGVYLSRILAANIGNDAVLSLRLAQANGLGNLLEKVDDRRTAQAKGAGVDGLLQPRYAVEKDDDVQSISRSGPCGAVELTQIHKKKLLREIKILLQQPI